MAQALAGVHWTLRPRTSAVGAVLAAIVAVATAALSQPRPVLIVCVGAAPGILAGVLQARAFGQARDRFESAQTALEVRKALRGTRAGTLSIVVLWLSLPAILVAWVMDGRPVLGPITGAAAVFCLRELTWLALRPRASA